MSQCGARTRKGAPCQAQPVPGKRRCKLHGGASTGPRSTEGRARIADAQRRRWAATRDARRARYIAATSQMTEGQHGDW
jgi:hypothetical protein